jgi:tetratricopeptide (TPR) repeat protein
MGKLYPLRKIRAQALRLKRQWAGSKGARGTAVVRHPAVSGRVIAPAFRPEALGYLDKAILLHEQDNPTAREMYRLAIEQGDRPAEAWCRLGQLESGSGWKQRALHCYQQAIRIAPRYFDAHYHIGNFYYDAGEIRLARVHYEIACDIDPHHAELTRQRAMLFLMERRFGEAILLLRRYADTADSGTREGVRKLIQRLRGEVAMDGT